jgi:hypothetical protein
MVNTYAQRVLQTPTYVSTNLCHLQGVRSKGIQELRIHLHVENY